MLADVRFNEDLTINWKEGSGGKQEILVETKGKKIGLYLSRKLRKDYPKICGYMT